MKKSFNTSFKRLMLTLATAAAFSSCAKSHEAPSIMDEMDPMDPSAEQLLDILDAEHEEATGQPSHIDSDPGTAVLGCSRAKCKVWARIDRSEQRLHLYIDGVERAIWKVSTGKEGHETPDFDRHPSGRIYDKYTSSKYPEGDYNGLGNMPYSVFIEGAYAIHGTPDYNWPKLGQARSKGCVRLHPRHAQSFITMVRQIGIRNVWITVEE
jgi:hypothetical protein